MDEVIQTLCTTYIQENITRCNAIDWLCKLDEYNLHTPRKAVMNLITSNFIQIQKEAPESIVRVSESNSELTKEIMLNLKFI